MVSVFLQNIQSLMHWLIFNMPCHNSTLLVSRMQLKQLIFKHFCAFVNIVYEHVNRNNVTRTCIEFISYVVHHVFKYACHHIFGWSSQLKFSWNWICFCLRNLYSLYFPSCLRICSCFCLYHNVWQNCCWAGNFFLKTFK